MFEWNKRTLVELELPLPPLCRFSLCNFVIRTVGDLPSNNEAALLPQLKKKQFNHTPPQEKVHIKAAAAAEAWARDKQVRERKKISVLSRECSQTSEDNSCLLLQDISAGWRFSGAFGSKAGWAERVNGKRSRRLCEMYFKSLYIQFVNRSASPAVHTEVKVWTDKRFQSKSGFADTTHSSYTWSWALGNDT